MSWGWSWRPYVPVAQRRAQALAKMQKLRKKGLEVQPVRIEGRQIARTFWGQAWCEHLEKFSDFENRLPRGRTYVRNGSVCHLELRKGKIAAKVSGSEIYDVEVTVKTVAGKKWHALKRNCAGQVGSLLELLQGKLSSQAMTLVTDRQKGLFPLPGEMGLKCSCPDWADMCKHVAAVLYGVGARLDEKPELLFLLRGVDHTELVSAKAAKAAVSRAPQAGRRMLDEGRVAEVFGIDVAPPPASQRKDTGAGASVARPKKPPAASRPGKAAAVARSREKPLKTVSGMPRKPAVRRP